MTTATSFSFSDRAHEYLELCKPKVVLLLVFTAVIGMFLATPGMVPLNALIFGSLGIGLCASSAAAINHLVDRQIDAKMARTKNRPLVSGNISTLETAAFAAILGLIGAGLLFFLVNPLTMWLTLLSLVGYAVVYTMYLKRATPQNIVIGGAAGASPPALGWTSVTGQIEADALILFLIIFAWTPPHFWALAIDRHKEYAAAGIPMLPVTHGLAFTRLQILLYTVILVIISVFPWLTGMSSLGYLVVALLLGGRYLYLTGLLYWRPNDRLPRQLFGYSIVYLMALFAALLVDHYLAPLLMS